MKATPFPAIFLTTLFWFAVLPAPVHAVPVVQTHDSSALVQQAWDFMQAKDYDHAIESAKKCITAFEKQALAQQKALTIQLVEKEEILAQKYLNDVGVCYFIVGQASDKLGKPADAFAAYKFLVDNFPFCRCWDPKGWFWSPPTAAQSCLKQLQQQGVDPK